MRMIVGLLALTLTGCAGYTYTKNGDDCKVWIASGRAVQDVDLTIDEYCRLTARAASLKTDDIYLRLIDKLVGVPK